MSQGFPAAWASQPLGEGEGIRAALQHNTPKVRPPPSRHLPLHQAAAASRTSAAVLLPGRRPLAGGGGGPLGSGPHLLDWVGV